MDIKYLLVFIIPFSLIPVKAQSIYRGTLPNTQTVELVIDDTMNYSIVVSSRYMLRYNIADNGGHEDVDAMLYSTPGEYILSQGIYSSRNDTVILNDNKWNCTMRMIQKGNNVSFVKGFHCLGNCILEKEDGEFISIANLGYKHCDYPLGTTNMQFQSIIQGEFIDISGFILKIKENYRWSIGVGDMLLMEGRWILMKDRVELQCDILNRSLSVRNVDKTTLVLNGLSREWICPYFESKSSINR